MRNNTAVSHWRSRNKSNQKHKQNGSSPVAGVANGNDEEFEAEQIMDKRVSISGRQVHYLVKWKGYPLDESTWEPPANLVNCKELIREYERAHAHEAHSHRPVTPLSASQRKRNRRSTAKTTGIGGSSKRRDGGSASGAGTGTDTDTSTEPPPAKRAVSGKLTSERDSDREKKLESEAEKFPEVIGTGQGQGSENNPDKSAEEKLPEPETTTEEERSSKLQSPSNVVCSNGGVEEEEEEEVLPSDHNKVDTCDQKDDVIKADTEPDQRAMSELRIPVNSSENISTENDESEKSENHDRNLNAPENNDDGKGEVGKGGVCSDIDDNNNTNNSINNSDNISDNSQSVPNEEHNQERLPQVQTSVAPQHSEEPEDVSGECESKIMEVAENGSAETQAEQPESERSEEQTKNPSNTSEEERLAGVSRILRITEVKHENGDNESEKNDAVAYDVEFKNGSCECLSWSAVHTYLKDHLIEFYERQLKIRQ